MHRQKLERARYSIARDPGAWMTAGSSHQSCVMNTTCCSTTACFAEFTAKASTGICEALMIEPPTCHAEPIEACARFQKIAWNWLQSGEITRTAHMLSPIEELAGFNYGFIYLLA